jgi:hypothetical protein
MELAAFEASRLNERQMSQFAPGHADRRNAPMTSHAWLLPFFLLVAPLLMASSI